MSTKSKAIVMTRFPYESAFGGEETHTIRLAEYFQKKGYAVIFLGSCPVLLQEFQKREFPTRKIWGGKMIVTAFQLCLSFFLFPVIRFNMRRHFKSLMKKFDIQALYCLSLNEKLFLTSFALRYKIPVTWVEHQELRNWFLKNPWRWMYEKYACHVKVIPIGKKNTETVQKYFPLENCHPIVHGISLPSTTDFKKQKQLVLWANRLIPKKGWEDFLKAIEMLIPRFPMLEAMIFGEGEEENRLVHQLRRNNLQEKISFSHFLKNENWKRFLSKADIFVISSRDASETFSISAAEAMAHGCKLVVTNVSGIAHLLTDKKNAFLANPSSPEDLSRCLTKAILSDNTMSQHAIAFARKNFDEQRMFSEYDSLLFRSS